MWTLLLKALMNPKVLGALVLSIVLCGSHWKAYKMGEHSRDTEIATENTMRAQGMLKLVERAQEKQAEIQAAAEKQTEVDHAQITKLNTDLNAARTAERMRRTARPAGYVPPTDATAAATPSCSARSLYAEDADVLIRLAGEADGLRIAYLGCQARYNAARTQLEAMRSKP